MVVVESQAAFQSSIVEKFHCTSEYYYNYYLFSWEMINIKNWFHQATSQSLL